MKKGSKSWSQRGGEPQNAANAAAGADPSEPTLAIPGVSIRGQLGRGAFATVYRGRHETLEVDVAVKVVSNAANDAGRFEHALAEARLMARLDHPNLLRIHDAGLTGSSIYLVLELMDGGALSGRHATEPDALVHLARQLLSGLQALHDARILHRDVKPGNCLRRERDGRVKLADLGIATELLTTMHVLDEARGTLPYMAPELFRSPPGFGPRSDLYGLGMTLAALALSEEPFPRDSVAQLLDWVREGERPRIAAARPDLDPALASLIQRLIAIDPEDRPASTAAALASLADAGRARPRTHRPPRTASESGSDDEGETGEVVGAWVLGEELHVGNNWHSRAATHTRTGAPAQFSHLIAKSRLNRSHELILQSAERAAELDHPGVLAMLDWGRREGRPYVVTAPRGRSLAELVESTGPLEEVEALRFSAALADALAYLHERGLVYQIVDPGSALITQDARSAQLGWPTFCVPIGTPAESEDGKSQRAIVLPCGAPEAFTKEGTIEPTVDIYGIGEVLYYLLVGRRAYDHTQTVEECLITKLKPPDDLRERAPEVTRPTESLLTKLLAPYPNRRPASAREVGDALRRIAGRLAGG